MDLMCELLWYKNQKWNSQTGNIVKVTAHSYIKFQLYYSVANSAYIMYNWSDCFFQPRLEQPYSLHALKQHEQDSDMIPSYILLNHQTRKSVINFGDSFKLTAWPSDNVNLWYEGCLKTQLDVNSLTSSASLPYYLYMDIESTCQLYRQ